jgi:hypothetical protein
VRRYQAVAEPPSGKVLHYAAFMMAFQCKEILLLMCVPQRRYEYARLFFYCWMRSTIA